MRPQSSLGDMSTRGRQDLNMNGMLMIGKVTKVHHKWHTADVVIIDTGNIIAGSSVTEGKFACRILERNAGYDEELGVSYGSITPIQKGDFVLVGFLRNLKSQPIILGAFHSLDSKLNLLPDEYPVKGDDTKYESLTVTRTQDYKWFSGTGELEMSHHSKAFVVGSTRDLDDSRDGFDFEDLHVKDKNGKTIGLGEEHFTPLDFLIVLKDKFDSAVSGFLKLWVSAKKGIFRISKDARNDKLTFIELKEDNTFRIKQQLDSHVRDEAKNYTEFVIDGEGNVEINRTNGDDKTIIHVNNSGEINIKTPQNVTVSSDNNISLKAKGSVSISADNVSMAVNGGGE